VKKLVLILIILLSLAGTSNAKTIFVAGDSICCAVGAWANGDISKTVYGRIRDYYTARGFTVITAAYPSELVANQGPDSGGYWALKVTDWLTAGCSLVNSQLENCLTTGDADELLIIGLGVNDIHQAISPDQTVTNMEQFITYAQSLGMHVTFVSDYPFAYTAGNVLHGDPGDGTSYTSCNTREDCTAVLNQNYHYYITQLALWFSSHGVAYIDFYDTQKTGGVFNDNLIQMNTEVGGTGVHLLTDEQLTIFANYIISNYFQASTTSVNPTTSTTSSTTTVEPTTTTTVPANQCAAETIYGRDSEETELLREYRDKVLSKSAKGRQMIKTYYELSPAVVEVLQKNDAARASARRILDSLMPAIREKVKH